VVAAAAAPSTARSSAQPTVDSTRPLALSSYSSSERCGVKWPAAVDCLVSRRTSVSLVRVVNCSVTITVLACTSGTTLDKGAPRCGQGRFISKMLSAYVWCLFLIIYIVFLLSLSDKMWL
jgi:hypothetical protein